MTMEGSGDVKGKQNTIKTVTHRESSKQETLNTEKAIPRTHYPY